MSDFQPGDECIGQQGEGHRHHGMPGTVISAGAVVTKNSADGVINVDYFAHVMWADFSQSPSYAYELRHMTNEDRIPSLIAAIDVIWKLRYWSKN